MEHPWEAPDEGWRGERPEVRTGDLEDLMTLIDAHLRSEAHQQGTCHCFRPLVRRADQ